MLKDDLQLGEKVSLSEAAPYLVVADPQGSDVLVKLEIGLYKKVGRFQRIGEAYQFIDERRRSKQAKNLV